MGLGCWGRRPGWSVGLSWHPSPMKPGQHLQASSVTVLYPILYLGLKKVRYLSRRGEQERNQFREATSMSSNRDKGGHGSCWGHGKAWLRRMSCIGRP